MLGSVQVMLNSPVGYDEDLESNFKNATSSCSNAGYPYTTPGVYSLGTATTSTNGPAPTQSCSSTYTVGRDDNCDSIAAAHGISSYSLISANGLHTNCDNMHENDVLCLIDPCTTYTIQVGDSCNAILESSNGTSLTATQLLAWNPNINALCDNIAPGMAICLRRVLMQRNLGTTKLTSA